MWPKLKYYQARSQYNCPKQHNIYYNTCTNFNVYYNPNCLKQLPGQSVLHYEDNLRENATKCMFISSILPITYEFPMSSLNSYMKTKKLRGNVDVNFLMNCKFALLLDPSIDFVWRIVRQWCHVKVYACVVSRTCSCRMQIYQLGTFIPKCL